MHRPDAVVFCISQQHLSAARQRELADAVTAGVALSAVLVRLEGTGPSLVEALDRFAASGHRTILVQPLGLPFSQSLAAWLPGALAHWLQSIDRADVEILLGPDQAIAGELLAQIAAAAAVGKDAKPIVGERPSLGKPGWDQPPPFRHHLIICTGPRCHFRGASDLRQALVAELARTGRSAECLIATSGCLYPCNQGPLLAAYPRGEWYRLTDSSEVARFVATVIGRNQPIADLIVHRVAPLGEAILPTHGESE